MEDQIKSIGKDKTLQQITPLVTSLTRKGFSIFSLLFSTKVIRKDSFYEKDDNLEKILDIIKYDPFFIYKVSKMNIRGLSNISIGDDLQHNIKTKTILNFLGKSMIKELIIKLFPEEMYDNIKKRGLFMQIIHHSLGVGVYSKILSNYLDLDPEEMFIAGMLHDIGKLILYVSMADEYEKAVDMAKERTSTSADCENEYFGMNHSEVGFMALRAWAYPKEFINIIKYHHNFRLIEEDPLTTQLSCIQAANILYNLSNVNVKNLRTFKVELFDKRMKDLTKNINIAVIMNQARVYIREIQSLFAL